MLTIVSAGKRGGVPGLSLRKQSLGESHIICANASYSLMSDSELNKKHKDC